MAVPMTGDFASLKAQAEKAYQDALASIATQRSNLQNRYGYNSDGSLNSNPYGQYQQIEHGYGNQRRDLANQQSDFTTQSNNSLGRMDEDHGTVLDRLGQDYRTSSGRLGEDYSTSSGRMGEDHATSVARLMDARSRAQFSAGLNASFDGSGNPSGVALSNANQHGAYQTMLGNQANQLASAEGQARARGLGTHGLGAQNVSALSDAQAGDRQSFVQSLMDSMRSNAQQLQDENTGYSRNSADLLTNYNRGNADLSTGYNRNTQDENTSYTRNRGDLTTSISQTMRDFANASGDLDYQHGLDQYNLGNNMADSMSGLDQQALGASNDYTNANVSGMLDNIISLINSGDVPGASAVTTQTPTTKSTPKTAAVVPRGNPTAALAARSAALNKKYGLGR